MRITGKEVTGKWKSRMTGIILLTLMVWLSGCGNQDEGKEKKRSSAPNKPSSGSVQPEPAPDKLADTNQVQQGESKATHEADSFMGVWKIEKLLDAPVSALSQTDVDKLIGLELAFTQDVADVDEDVLEKPHYTAESQSLLEFRDGGNIVDD